MIKDKLTQTIAKTISDWLMKDIRLNANAASSPHIYEPIVPNDLKKYKNKWSILYPTKLSTGF